MKRIVIDTSAIIAVILGETHREALIRITRDVHLTAPLSLRWEVGNAFSAMFRKKSLSAREAAEAIRIFEMIPIEEVAPDLSRSIELAHAKNIYAYDAYMLDVALSHKAPLLTLDAGLVRVARTLKITIPEV